MSRKPSDSLLSQAMVGREACRGVQLGICFSSLTLRLVRIYCGRGPDPPHGECPLATGLPLPGDGGRLLERGRSRQLREAKAERRETSPCRPGTPPPPRHRQPCLKAGLIETHFSPPAYIAFQRKRSFKSFFLCVSFHCRNLPRWRGAGVPACGRGGGASALPFPSAPRFLPPHTGTSKPGIYPYIYRTGFSRGPALHAAFSSV